MRWLDVGKGEVAAELLGRLGDIDSLRVATGSLAHQGDRQDGRGSCKEDSVSLSHRLFV
jgi:hypothetical protein